MRILAIAHCLNAMDLQGQNIGIEIGGFWIRRHAAAVSSSTGAGGQGIEQITDGSIVVGSMCKHFFC